MFDLRNILRACVLVAAVAVSGSVSAQNADRPATPVTGFNSDKAEIHANEVMVPGVIGIKPVTGFISIPDTRAATLIQPDGRIWRDYRRGPLLWITAAAVVGMIGLLAVFYLVRGRIMIEGGRAAMVIKRFGSFERFMHWLTAFSWCILAVSGLNIVAGRFVLLPLLGNEAFTTLSVWLKYSHNFVAFPFMTGVVLMFLVWLRHNIPNRDDLVWFAKGGGLFGHEHPDSGKFNGGQKAVFWIVVLGGTGLSITGLGLLFPFTVTGIVGMQLVQVIHGGISLGMIAAMLGHIYIGSVGMEGALDAMKTGEVDLNWAQAHHNLWVAEELKKGTIVPHAAE
jgi:formate dehydrogenase subunit gamma